MKKYITLLLLVLLMPTFVFAEPAYTSQTLKEALESEKIEADLGDYSESDEKVNIYLFRGDGCPHCQEFLEYVANDLVKEMGDKFNVVSYEVWNDKNNAELMESISKKLEDDASGVPYIVIGDKSFSGYAESMNDEIKEAINTLYDSEEKYDVFTQLEIDPSAEKPAKKTDNTSIIVLTIMASITIIALVVASIKK